MNRTPGDATNIETAIESGVLPFTPFDRATMTGACYCYS
jgi:hypothetical protein